MSDPRIDRYNTALAKVNAVLHEVWAPIGFGGLPRDEYETYAVRCLSLFASGASETELVAYLVSAGGALADEPGAHAKRSAEAVHQLMKYEGEIAP